MITTIFLTGYTQSGIGLDNDWTTSGKFSTRFRCIPSSDASFWTKRFLKRLFALLVSLHKDFLKSSKAGQDSPIVQPFYISLISASFVSSCRSKCGLYITFCGWKPHLWMITTFCGCGTTVDPNGIMSHRYKKWKTGRCPAEWVFYVVLFLSVANKHHKYTSHIRESLTHYLLFLLWHIAR